MQICFCILFCVIFDKNCVTNFLNMKMNPEIKILATMICSGIFVFVKHYLGFENTVLILLTMIFMDIK